MHWEVEDIRCASATAVVMLCGSDSHLATRERPALGFYRLIILLLRCRDGNSTISFAFVVAYFVCIYCTFSPPNNGMTIIVHVPALVQRRSTHSHLGPKLQLRSTPFFLSSSSRYPDYSTKRRADTPRIDNLSCPT